ncbi:MAG: HNH endonuclease [Candidatus Eisenbacteria bacterium]|uniref:HNH endonuclease n=1 Tax=Eiseniibacteriota bacterium TaxID=2212470 RepID=A0A538TW78_UNCEI|nr:MAG: HNH endonuclease [Candidatus Eisenbacteria bacterium]
METYSFSHFSDETVLRQLTAVVHRERATTAEILGLIGEVDTRRLYLPLGYSSTYAYCTEALQFSEDTASKRIRVARLAREFPQIFSAVADGWLSLSALVVLAPHINAENVEELLSSAVHKKKHEIERLIARRSEPSLTLDTGVGAPEGGAPSDDRLARTSNSSAPGRIEIPSLDTAPVAASRIPLHVAISENAHELLRYARALLGHQIPSGDVAQVLERLLLLGIVQLEKRKFGKSDRPRAGGEEPNSPRVITAQVRRAVVERDGGRCTFIGSKGHRCGSDRFLEFDHIVPVARGGRSTVDNIRLRCRAHNQYEADQAFGSEFMKNKREEARATGAARAAAAIFKVEAKASAEEVIPYLRKLGIRADDARRAAEKCESIPDASLEARVKLALSCFGR